MIYLDKFDLIVIYLNYRNIEFNSFYKNNKKMLSLDHFDPNWKDAENHGLANKAGIPTIAGN
jgi:hypothetical protein